MLSLEHAQVEREEEDFCGNKITVHMPDLAQLASAIQSLGDTIVVHAGPQPESFQPAEPKTAIAEPKTAIAEPKTATVKPEPKNTYTLERVRAKLAKLAQAGKQKEVKELITDFGVKKLTGIPGDKYPELMKKAEEIS